MIPIAEQLLGRRDDYLLEQDENGEKLDSTHFRVMYGARVWMGEILSGRRSPLEVFRAERGRNESIFEYIFNGVDFIRDMDVADRAANGLRDSLKYHLHDPTRYSQFGQKLDDAYNNPFISHHNHEHDRRVERWLEAELLNIGELRHAASVKHWINSALLVPYFHDIDQMLSIDRNLESQERDEHTKELPSKAGHGLAAAVMLLALHKRYGQEAAVRKDKAWEICAGAAYMILKHEKPNKMMQALHDNTIRKYRDEKEMNPDRTERGNEFGEKAYEITDGRKILLHGKDLRIKYDNNELDLTTLSPSQLVELLRMVKRENGFINSGNPGSFGLYPEFEVEYKDELTELASDDRPILDNIDSDLRYPLNLAAEATIRADMLDMVSPSVFSIFRKLAVQISKNRPFYKIRSIDELYKLILSDNGDLPPDSDCDVRRMLWELVHIDEISHDSLIAQSRFMREVNRDYAIMGVLAIQHIGESIMNGDLSVITDAYDERIIEVSKKALERAGYNPMTINWNMYIGKNQNDFDTYVAYMIEKASGWQEALKYKKKVIQLQTEAQNIQTQIATKIQLRPEGDHLVTMYSDQNRSDFHIITERVIGKLMADYGVEPKRKRRLEKIVYKYKKSPNLPYRGYDSIPAGKPRTVRKRRKN